MGEAKTLSLNEEIESKITYYENQISELEKLKADDNSVLTVNVNEDDVENMRGWDPPSLEDFDSEDLPLKETMNNILEIITSSGGSVEGSRNIVSKGELSSAIDKNDLIHDMCYVKTDQKDHDLSVSFTAEVPKGKFQELITELKVLNLNYEIK